MDLKEATLLVGRIISRYPSATPSRGLLAVWAEELAERSKEERDREGRLLRPEATAEDCTRLAIGYCRANPSQFMPSLDVLCRWIGDRLREEHAERTKQLQLEAPPMPRESFRAGIAELFRRIGADRIGRPMPRA